VIPVGPLEHAEVRLEPLARQHVDALAEAACVDRSTFDLAPVPGDRDAAVRYVDRALADFEAKRAVPFAVLHAGKVVGSYRLMSLEWWTWPEGPVNVSGDPRRVESDPPDVAEIGHAWLTRSAQRTVVNTTVAYLLMRHAFEAWRVHRLVLKTDARNTRSRNAITRLGGTLEGVLRSHQPAADGIVRDTAMFSIVAAEWPEVRARLLAQLGSTPP
jgi:RimJ/RimL family protein N-acetyltransferase